MNALAQINAALMAALTGQAEEVRFEPMGDPSADTALDLFFSGYSPLEHEHANTRYEAGFEIAGYVTGLVGDGPIGERIALHARALAAIMADETLGGVAELIEDGDADFFTAALTSVQRLAFSIRFTVQFATPRGDFTRIA